MIKRFTEEQIIGILKEAEAGLTPTELCRKYGIWEATYYNWKAKFSGTTVSEAQRLKEPVRRTTSSSACWPNECSTTPR
ncbi:transposase [Paraburkholderia youngii]|uniref:transposase n=1 Tax=Paraburkholderia youngii TaxID=2782701 RepID=UPI001595F8CC|nr:transposase [Paraburkholderia youngii]